MAIVEAGEGTIGVFVPALDINSLYDTHRITYTVQQNNGGSSSHWKMEKTIPMGSQCMFMLLYIGGRSPLEAGYFTLDVKTWKLERVCYSSPIPKSHAYCNFPPSILSLPTVSSGKLSSLSY
jgi:hypothetical protein